LDISCKIGGIGWNYSRDPVQLEKAVISAQMPQSLSGSLMAAACLAFLNSPVAELLSQLVSVNEAGYLHFILPSHLKQDLFWLHFNTSSLRDALSFPLVTWPFGVGCIDKCLHVNGTVAMTSTGRLAAHRRSTLFLNPQ
jgi:hypothetical protein